MENNYKEPFYGYGRVIPQSPVHYNKEKEIKALLDLGVPEENIIIDTDPTRNKRYKLTKLKKELINEQKSGTLYITELDCLSDYLKTVANDIKELHEHGITVIAGSTAYDFTDEGKLRFQELQHLGHLAANIKNEKEHRKFPYLARPGRKQIGPGVKKRIIKSYLEPLKNGQKPPTQQQLANQFNISLRSIGSIIRAAKKENNIL